MTIDHRHRHRPDTLLPLRLVISAGLCCALILGLAGALSAQPPEPQPPTPQPPELAPPDQQDQEAQQAIFQQLTELRDEIGEVETKLQDAQQQALNNPDVQKEQQKYETALEQAMTAAEPDVKETLDRRSELLDQIRSNPELEQADAEAEPSPELQQQIQDLQSLEQRLAPVRQRVADDPAVKPLQVQFEQVLLAEMEKLEPETPELLERHARLIQRFQQLQQQLR